MCGHRKVLLLLVTCIFTCRALNHQRSTPHQVNKTRNDGQVEKVFDCPDGATYLTCFKEIAITAFENPRVYFKYLGNFLNTSTSDNISVGDYTVIINPKSDATYSISIARTPPTTLRSTGKGWKNKMLNFLPYALVPALAMAGVMPWVMPVIKTMVMFVSMLNNMAFSSALFMLVRNYIFNTQQEEHIIYINHGYKKKEPPRHRPAKE